MYSGQKNMWESVSLRPVDSENRTLPLSPEIFHEPFSFRQSFTIYTGCWNIWSPCLSFPGVETGRVPIHSARIAFLLLLLYEVPGMESGLVYTR